MKKGGIGIDANVLGGTKNMPTQPRKAVSDMKKYEIIAYPDEDGNKRQEATIEANNQEDAYCKAWRMFPEYHEIGVYEIEGE